jgi:RNA polymerase sigma-54 factor
MLNQKLSQKLLQRLSPAQIQLMKLIQTPTMQLEERIQQEIEVNPALETGLPESDEKQELAEIKSDDVKEETAADNDTVQEVTEENAWEEELNDLSAYYEDDDVADYKLKSNNYPDPDEEERVIPVAVQKSFYEYLEAQLRELELEDTEHKIAEQLIGSIDEDGYLKRELEAIVDDLAFQQSITADEEAIETVLEKIQQLEPPGVGARNLKECLLLQVNKLKPKDPGVPLAYRIIEEQFDAFTKKNYVKIQRELNLEDKEFKEAMDVILKLNPKPGSSYSGAVAKEQYIIPDFIITNNNGILELTLNSRNVPDLRVSRDFKDMMRDFEKTEKKTKQQKEAIFFIKQKIDSAQWFIDAIKQRHQTLMGTMQAIMKYQYDYFLTGDETKLKKMILKDIADVTGQDVSTVSRVSSSKYVQTEFGIIPLKFFFSEGIKTDSGEEVSSREVKSILQELIQNEDKSNPITDHQLTEELKKRGYKIARRTIAKYREMLEIPIAKLRREL